ncbi:hypothetical protein HBH47_000540 [Parastagonospora nodorum]|nr:hypothetical protein HBH47_000540 [Parastagonospora nodorum]
MSDSGFRTLGNKVEDGGTGCFGAGSCCCGDSDEGEEFSGDGHSLAEGCIHKVEEIGFGERSIQVHQFGGVDDAAASDGEVGVGLPWSSIGDGFLDGMVFGLDSYFVIYFILHAFSLQSFNDLLHGV